MCGDMGDAPFNNISLLNFYRSGPQDPSDNFKCTLKFS